MEKEENKIFVYLIAGMTLLAGIGIILYFVKDHFKASQPLQPQQQVMSTQALGQMLYTNPRIDELEKLTNDLNTETRVLKEELDNYKYQLSISQKEKPQPKVMYQLSQQSRAGSPYTINTVAEDKSRQKMFDML